YDETSTPAGRCVVKLARTAQAAFRHPFHDRCAKPTPLRRRHGRSIAFCPAHGQGVAVAPPADINATSIVRERSVFPGIGGELVEREADGLSTNSVPPQPPPVYDNT